MAEADHPDGLLRVQLLIAFFQMDVKILIGVVIIHVDGYIKIYPADGLHNGTEGIQIHRYIVIHRHTKQFGYRLGHGLALAVSVYGIDLAVFAVAQHQGIPGNGHQGGGFVVGIKAAQHNRVRPEVALIAAGEQAGINSLPSGVYHHVVRGGGLRLL